MATNHTPPLVTGPRELALLSFHRDPLNSRYDDAPLGFAMVALWHGDRLLLVHERGRKCWELPGGGIEPGETPLEAAVRELREETEQVADEGEGLRFVGFSKTALGPKQKVLYGALFTGRTSAPRPFTPNEEVSELCWRDGDAQPPGGSPLQTVDIYLADLCRG